MARGHGSIESSAMQVPDDGIVGAAP